jgi:hypothetical protein
MGLLNKSGRNEYDLEDVAPLLVFAVSAAVAFVPSTTVQFYGHGLDQWAFIGMIAPLGFAYATNWASSNKTIQQQMQDLDTVETGAVVGTVVVVAGFEYIPQVADFIASNDAYGIGAFLIAVGGFVTMAYRG